MHPASARTPASVPDLVGRYEILLPIASGGMATVYLARAVGAGGFSTEVALKLTHAHLRTSTEFTNDLVEEAKLASRIRHRNVVAIIDVGDDPQGVYLAMEYVEGDTLAGIFRAKPRIPQALGVRVLLDSLAGLHAAHELRDEGGQLIGLVHRDFTPQNILVGIDGVARLADFGIAKAATRLGHTRTGIVKGKIPYMAPEQAHGVVLDRRCDVWAAGIVAWELFAERRLYRNEDDVSTLLRVATERPPLLRTVVPDLPEPIEAAVAHALTMDANARTPTAQAFAKELWAACRDTAGIAEIDEVAGWMESVILPRVSGRRMQAAMAKLERESVQVTRVERSSPSGSQSVAFVQPAGPSAVQTAYLDRPPMPTEALPTIASEHETKAFTDGVSVVARAKTGRSLRASPRSLVAVGVAALLAVVGFTAWHFTGSHSDPSRSASPPGAAAALAPGPSSVPLAPTGSAAAPSPIAAPRSMRLRLHGNAEIAFVRVNDRPIAIGAPASTVNVRFTTGDDTSSLAIDATALDGRRSSVVVPAGISDVTLDFHGPVPAQAPVRTVPVRVTNAPAAAPLAPSPY
ncbi:MAG TPA: serine/threonine-protein kinase [Polyangiaceae bacterium]